MGRSLHGEPIRLSEFGSSSFRAFWRIVGKSLILLASLSRDSSCRQIPLIYVVEGLREEAILANIGVDASISAYFEQLGIAFLEFVELVVVLFVHDHFWGALSELVIRCTVSHPAESLSIKLLASSGIHDAASNLLTLRARVNHVWSWAVLCALCHSIEAMDRGRVHLGLWKDLGLWAKTFIETVSFINFLAQDWCKVALWIRAGSIRIAQANATCRRFPPVIHRLPKIVVRGYGSFILAIAPASHWLMLLGIGRISFKRSCVCIEIAITCRLWSHLNLDWDHLVIGTRHFCCVLGHVRRYQCGLCNPWSKLLMHNVWLHHDSLGPLIRKSLPIYCVKQLVSSWERYLSRCQKVFFIDCTFDGRIAWWTPDKASAFLVWCSTDTWSNFAVASSCALVACHIGLHLV